MFILIILICCSWFFACQNTVADKQKVVFKNDSVQKTDSVRLASQKKVIQVDTLKDDLVSILCALPPKKNYKNVAGSAFWEKYRNMVNNDWSVVTKHKITPIKTWSDSMDLAFAKDTCTLFYPFAGADFLYANSFFPKASNYILIGLEPVGFLKSPDSLKETILQNYLNKIENSLYFSNKVGFFRTNSMRAELNQHELDGTIHLLSFYIKRCGYSISGIEYFSLDTLGKPVEYNKKDSAKPYAVKINFCDSTLKTSQALYYFSYDISDNNLKKHGEILKFAKGFGKQHSFLKAASYLMHTAEFTSMKQYILDNCSSVLQDDSGVPYRFFTAGSWDVKLFGTYSKTISLFRHKYQADLKAAIDKSPYKGRIPFRIGYNVNHNEVNLIYAIKKQ